MRRRIENITIPFIPERFDKYTISIIILKEITKIRAGRKSACPDIKG
jgi:hypothetical protein